MEVLEAIKTRRSVRRFLDRPVENEKLLAILEAIRMSPSWANLQCWRIIVIKDASVKEKISELCNVEAILVPLGVKTNPAMKGLAEAPVVLIACADPSQSGVSWNQPYYLTDMGITTQSLMLAAPSLGLGSVFVGAFYEEGIRRLLNIPSNIRIVGLFPIGYPKEEKKAGPERKPLNEIVFYERWGKTQI